MHENATINFKKKVLKKSENNYVTEDEDGISFECSYFEKVYIMIIIDSWSRSGEAIHISIMKEFKLVILKLRLLRIVHQDHLNQD